MNSRFHVFVSLVLSAVLAFSATALAWPTRMYGYYEGKILRRTCSQQPTRVGPAVVFQARLPGGSPAPDTRPALTLDGLQYYASELALKDDGSVVGTFLSTTGRLASVSTVAVELKGGGNFLSGYRLTGTLKGRGACGDEEITVELTKQ